MDKEKLMDAVSKLLDNQLGQEDLIEAIADAVVKKLGEQKEETKEELKARILDIKDPIERQQAIRDNWSVFNESN